MFQASSKQFVENLNKPLFDGLPYGHINSHIKNLLHEVDHLRVVASQKQEQQQKGTLGQFLTNAAVSELMAMMFDKVNLSEISLLDAGAGVGSLLAAFVANVCNWRQYPAYIKIVAYEIDPVLIGYLQKTLALL